MQSNNLTKENVAVREYESPDCKVFFVKTQGIICTSETEKVNEIDGEW